MGTRMKKDVLIRSVFAIVLMAGVVGCEETRETDTAQEVAFEPYQEVVLPDTLDLIPEHLNYAGLAQEAEAGLEYTVRAKNGIFGKRERPLTYNRKIRLLAWRTTKEEGGEGHEALVWTRYTDSIGNRGWALAGMLTFIGDEVPEWSIPSVPDNPDWKPVRLYDKPPTRSETEAFLNGLHPYIGVLDSTATNTVDEGIREKTWKDVMSEGASRAVP